MCLRLRSAATSNPGGNRLLRKDPTGQITAWKARDALRKRLVKQLTKNGTEKIGSISRFYCRHYISIRSFTQII